MPEIGYPPGFEWDGPKAQANLAKHGVDFVLATLVFAGPHRIMQDERAYQGETRYKAVGEADGRPLFVVFTWREGRRRIISAWLAGSR